MPTDWRDRLSELAALRPAPIQAIDFIKIYQSDAKPALMRCSDGQNWVLKGAHKGRVPFNDQVALRLGRLLDAPTPEANIVELSNLIIQSVPQLQGNQYSSGLCHGSKFIPDCGDRASILNQTVQINRDRFAALAILYGWLFAGDHQVIYSTSSSLVWSVDHGHFFPNGPGWTSQALTSAANPVPDANVMRNLQLSPVEISPAFTRLQAVTDADICTAISMPPETWGVSLQERADLVSYLIHRRDTMRI